MTVNIPKTEYCGEITAPPSKSAAHRALICAGLSGGKSVIHGISDSDDMRATIDCLTALGAEISLSGSTATVRGIDPSKRDKKVTLNCRESGSTLRFFIPICMLSEYEAVLQGSTRLMERPLDVYEKICAEQGIVFERGEGQIKIKGKLSGGFFRVPGDISSQFISGLMFAMPFLSDYGIIEITPPVTSAPYIRMTADIMSRFGAYAELTDNGTVIVKGGKLYKCTDIDIEGDWSNGAFFLALEALGHDVSVCGLDSDSLQGDKIVRRYLAKLCRGNPVLDVTDCPDLAPVLMSVAAALNGGEFIGTDRLKLKECDRGEAMAEELAKLGVTVLIGNDSIIVEKPNVLSAPCLPIQSHNDHRIVMALAVLLTLVGGDIEGAEAVNKSYPDFFNNLFSLTEDNYGDK